MENKRGMDAIVGILIAIGIGVVIIVLSSFALTGGFQSLQFWVPKNNVQSVVTQCASNCAQGSTYDFCTAAITLRAQDIKDTNNKALPEVIGSCKNFSNQDAMNRTGWIRINNYGISSCPALSC